MLPSRLAHVATGAPEGRPLGHLAGRPGTGGIQTPRRTAPLCSLAGVVFSGAALAVIFESVDASAASIWRSASSGFWSEATNWTSPTAPTLATGGVYITNQAMKTVTVDAQTPTTNLFINGLNVWGPSGTTNTLLLSGGTTNHPLVVSNQTMTVASGGLVVVTNSSLVVTGRFINCNLWAGDMRLDSGSIIVREVPLTTNVTAFTRIGRTNLATLTINDGVMEASDLYLGDSPGRQFGRSHGLVRMNGGMLTVNGELSVAAATGCTGTVEMVGGRLLVPNNLTNILRVGDMGDGRMTLSNAVARVGDVSVGRHDGAFGLLVLQRGGDFLCSDDLSIGRFPGSTGTVLVTGGHLGLDGRTIWVGREGSGQLILSNGLVSAGNVNVAAVPTNLVRGLFTLAGGSAQAFSNFVVGASSGATGQVTLTAGSLTVTNPAGTASLSIEGGTIICQGGEICTDSLFVRATRGLFVFNGGTLRSAGTVFSNGLPFIVGDGVRPATLHLLGGTHVFADGLVISSNATLSGCGTIIGALSNHGTDSRDCGTNTGPPVITQQPMSLTVRQGDSATFSVRAAGTEPLSYQWRFGIPGSGGGDIPGATAASLTRTNVQLTNAGNYRVIISSVSGTTTSDVATLRVLVTPEIGAARFDGNSFLEFKDRLDAPTWTPLGSAAGTGSMLTLMDATPAVPARFYRVRVE